MFVMKIDHWALGYAVLLETVLAVVAAFGGPHGTLGMLPWLLQFPGALLIFFSPDTVNKVFLLVLTFLIQVAIWYAVIATVRALRHRRKELNAS